MLTVLLATRNGGRSLPGALEAHCQLLSPEGGWRLVVIENASTDNTRDIVRSFAPRLPLIYLHEANVGKNSALNTGLGAVAGDLVVLTDDDVFPCPDWLLRLRAAAEAHPECAIFGGSVLPRWEAPPPPWVLAWVGSGPVFSLTNPRIAAGPTGAENVFGPNMAIRAEIFADGCRFDSSIGPRGSSYAMGSETELVNRLLRQGHRAWYAPEAKVEHLVRASQLDKGWILRRAVRYGRGQYRLESVSQTGQVTRWHGVPRYLYRELLRQALLTAIGAVRFDRERVFRARWEFNFTRGQIIEAGIVHGERAARSAG